MLAQVKSSSFLNGIYYEIAEAWQASAVPKWAEGQPSEHHTLLYIARGKGELNVNGQALKLERDALYMYPPETSLKLTASSGEELQLFWIAFDIYRLLKKDQKSREYQRDAGFPLQGYFRGGSRYKQLFNLLVAEGQLWRIQNPFLSQQYLHDMLDGFLRYAELASNDIDLRVQLTLDYLQNHYQEDIRIDQLADMAQLHPSYYFQVFKQAMDKSPIAFLIHLRVNRAKEMLLLTDKPIKEIAAEVGYKDEFYFSREDFLLEQPDLILCKDNVLFKAREHINDIAPVVAIPWVSQDIYTQLLKIGEFLNREEEAVKWLESHERKAQNLRKALRSITGSGTVGVCVCREHELRMYGARNVGHALYRSLQLTPPERIQAQMNLHPAGTGFNWTAITPDGLKDYDCDFIFFAVETEGDKRRIHEWQKNNPAWMQHSAIRSKLIISDDDYHNHGTTEIGGAFLSAAL
ncbi:MULTISPECIES: helix-turn-helix domain-containing protein [unclassified Paenibacillus]|uniref:helix-turn-helix domain-containing protein n=1 Tax=unclassified Paenibacillus TaxID=185978 RepID=UPI0024053F53|nr:MULTISPECIES: helix-turn-helix domain-containing protein [unclassified Paenibacillus]MDF9839468.1 AraC-like DNA-binding protein [Paenibacillus sp. PastF-2]MDF9846049.1 AraC-like DNA-binding protein [Paenibacillus sp. PastM-2]MDF9852622.1 AraC-like DNA-binding protein [Paenibacillus sp. PastF-1]MDH6477647.1 AraC-like DNA-binding protein [Paenibacillus sp. PastH-2]MDH6505389.1 AraC-like DNA-binding protein [Paenibacillus sp. PastM-3]